MPRCWHFPLHDSQHHLSINMVSYQKHLISTELKVKVAQADKESDIIVGALARANGCCAVSKDSDFFIFELPFGYIPIDNLEVRTTTPLPVSLSQEGVSQLA
jgi:predicted nuclease of predicted toxin-antitoxin system